MNWVVALITGLIVGSAIGWIICRLIRRHPKQVVLQQQLDNTKKELMQYRIEMNKHFIRSSELLDTMVNEYKQLYCYFSESSQALTDATLSMTEQNPFDLPAVEIAQLDSIHGMHKRENSHSVALNDSHLDANNNNVQPRDYSIESVKQG